MRSVRLRRMIPSRWSGVALTLAMVASAGWSGCASLPLNTVVQAPVVEEAPRRDPTMRVSLPTTQRPAGAASVRLWSRVENPNRFGFTLTRVAGDLVLGEDGAIEVDFPLGLPLEALQDTVIPLDLTLDLDDLPALGETLLTVIADGELDYRLEGTIAIDAGVLGEPTFGPRTWMSGTLRVSR